MPEFDTQTQPDDFDVEIVALPPFENPRRGLDTWLLNHLLDWQRPAYRRQRRWFSRSLLIGLVLIAFFTIISSSPGLADLLATYWPLHGSQTAVSPANARAFAIAGSDITCPVQVAWSSNSAFVSVLGYTQPCNRGIYVPAQVDIYSPLTGQQITHWSPDQLILTTVQQAAYTPPLLHALAARKPVFVPGSGPNPLPVIVYQQMLWSPDTTTLALSYQLTTRFFTYAGIFLAHRDGSRPEVVLQREMIRADEPREWDLQRGASASFTSPPVALAYTWGTHGRLLPLAPRSISPGDTPAPTGNPASGKAFSIWQPGRPLVLSQMHTPGVYLWSTSFAAWSPDGRYLITNLSFSGLIEPPGHAFPDARYLQSLNASGLPRVPAHDSALIPNALSAMMVAWNPSGSLLAVYDLSEFVDLYDCSSGALLRTLRPLNQRPLSRASTTLLSWSPDGHHLLISSAQWGLMALWNFEHPAGRLGGSK